jgi:2-iminobutanoate/2-iminopropanoate deaminase
MSAINPIQLTDRPAPLGHYSPGIIAAGFLFVSGQLPIDMEGRPRSDLPFSKQVDLVLRNVRSVLESAGCELNSLVQVRVYLDDVANWPEFNSIYAGWIGSHRPARCVVPVAKLHYAIKVEVEAVALMRSPTQS